MWVPFAVKPIKKKRYTQRLLKITGNNPQLLLAILVKD
jgi:hypothetical protein